MTYKRRLIAQFLDLLMLKIKVPARLTSGASCSVLTLHTFCVFSHSEEAKQFPKPLLLILMSHMKKADTSWLHHLLKAPALWTSPQWMLWFVYGSLQGIHAGSLVSSMVGWDGEGAYKYWGWVWGNFGVGIFTLVNRLMLGVVCRYSDESLWLFCVPCPIGTQHISIRTLMCLDVSRWQY